MDDSTCSDTDDSRKKNFKEKLGFDPQKTIAYNKLLPYTSQLCDEIILQLKDIKENLSKAVILRDLRPSGIYWISQLSRFIKLHGLCFSKEDHVLLVKLAYELVIIEDQEFWVTGKYAEALIQLLKKRDLLSPEDLQLPWRPLAKIYLNVFHSSVRRLGMMLLPHNAESLYKSTIRHCRPYFPIESSREILEECRPHFCPYDLSMYQSISFIELFLPTMLSPDQSQHGWKLWLDELLNIESSYHNEPSWASTLFCLFARLAWQNIGYISWEEHIPLVFTRTLYQFHLPVSYKKSRLNSKRGLDTWAISMFIVSNLGGGSQTQNELERMFKVLESYFHPSNTGYWTKTLNDFQTKLTQYFVQRLHNERYKKPSWVSTVPEEKKLTEDDITAFVKCIQPAANLTVFAKTGSYEAGLVLNRLALLRPEIVIPPIIEQLYSSILNMTEPHRLIAAMQCIVRVARPLVTGGKRLKTDASTYPEGPTHVIPLLIDSLPGIDPNDINKCMATFTFIATLVSLIPISDCSAATEEIEDLTQIEQQVCLQTREFENFILQFMSRCFALIESSTLEQVLGLDRESDSMNFEESLVEIGLSAAFKAILTQSHPDLFDVALDTLVNYTKGRCMETSVAGKLIANMWRSAARTDSEKTLKALIPSVCHLILTLSEYEEAQEDENLDDKLLFNMLLLSELVQAHSIYVLPYIPKITEVLRRTLHFKSQKGYKMASQILRQLLWSFNATVPTETRSFKSSWDAPLNEFLPIRHWGETGDIDHMDMKWLEPGKEQEEVISTLVNEFLIPELQVIEKVAGGDKSISRDRFHQSLSITHDMLSAAGSLPMWEEKPIELIELCVKRSSCESVLRSYKLKVTVNHPDFPSNVRLAIAETTLRLIDTLLKQESDDTKAFNFTISILYGLAFNHGVLKEEFEIRWKGFERVKQSLSDSIVRKKQLIRALLIQRAVLQYELRILDANFLLVFTETHKKIISSLFKLSTSQYSEVRKKSQSTIGSFFRHFPYSYKLVLSQIIDTLGMDPKENHKQIKGALFVIHGSKEKSLIVRRDWDTLNSLCPAVIAAQHSEKPSIVKLYDALLNSFARYFELFAIQLKVSDEAISAARVLLDAKDPTVEDPTVAMEEEAKGLMKLDQRSQSNLKGYLSLVKNLVSLFDSGNLHWRRTHFCLHILSLLVRPDVAYPAEGARVMLTSCIDDNIVLRKISLYSLVGILKNQKRPHKKRKINPLELAGKDVNLESNNIVPGGGRLDNRWMQYDKSSLSLTEKDWETKVFVHKTWHGWYCWPKEIEVYCPPSEQPSLSRSYDQLTEAEKVVYDFFIDSNNVDKLVSFLSLEEFKGADKFDLRKCKLFKGLFRNFGDTFVPLFEPHLRRLVNDSQESSQRCAAEIIAGMMRGTKHWPFESSQRVLNLTCELFKVVLNNVLNETLCDWGTCLMNISMDRDPNRMAPLFEMFLEDPVQQEKGSFLASSRLMLCQFFLEQQEWRIADIYTRLLDTLKPNLFNPFKIIRDRIGVLLWKIFMDYEFENSSNLSSVYPRQSEFVDWVLPHLSIVIQECGRGGVSVAEISPSHHPGAAPSTGGDSPSILRSSFVPQLNESLQQSLLSNLDRTTDSECPQPLGNGSDHSLGEPMDLMYAGGVKGSEIASVSVPGNGFQPGDSEERKVALRLMNTICKFLICKANYSKASLPAELYKFLPHLCQLESIDSDLELQSNCVSTLAYLSSVPVLPIQLGLVFQTVKEICQVGWWRARIAALSFVQVVIFNSMFSVIDSEEAMTLVRDIVMKSLEDPRPEVRQMASQVLSGLFHCNIIIPNRIILDSFCMKLNRHKRKRDKATGRLIPLSVENINEKHTGALGLKAYILAYPYDVPTELPEALVALSEHVNDPEPIANDIKKTLSDFRRTHHDNWRDHKTKFTSDQLSILTDVLISPSYYA